MRLKDKLMQGHMVYGTLIQHAVVPAMVDFIPENTIGFVIVSAAEAVYVVGRDDGGLHSVTKGLADCEMTFQWN